MNTLPQVVDQRTIVEKVEEATDVSLEIENPDGEIMDVPEGVVESVQIRNVSDTIVEHLSQVAPQLSKIKKSTLSFGSGDSGRQSQLYLQPFGEVSKDELRIIAEDIDELLDKVFPTDYLVGIKHGMTIDEGYPKETDELFIFVVYNVRSHGRVSRPPGASTEVV